MSATIKAETLTDEAMALRFATALVAISGLTFLACQEEEENERLLGEIYTIAHQAIGTCAGRACQNFDETIAIAKKKLEPEIVNVDKQAARSVERWKSGLTERNQTRH